MDNHLSHFLVPVVLFFGTAETRNPSVPVRRITCRTPSRVLRNTSSNLCASAVEAAAHGTIIA